MIFPQISQGDEHSNEFFVRVAIGRVFKYKGENFWYL